MKIVRIDGGLGNQMFCYAFALSLRESSGEEVLIDSHRYAFFPNHNGYELDKLFELECREATCRELWKVTIPAYSVFQSRILQRLPHRRTEIREDYNKFYSTLVAEHPDGYYIGNWQCADYFHKYRDSILKEFEWKNALDERNLVFTQQLIDNENSISIHIRRGDYLSEPHFRGICELDYYEKAIKTAYQHCSKKTHFVIFSNDIEWCKDNIAPLIEDGTITYVDWNTGMDSHKDIRLMSVCRINIIANSSFSWWAAYLNQRADKIVIAPDRWINLPLEYRIQMPQWICI